LPATNCKTCGQPTCFTFALKLTAGELQPELCAPLFTDAYREKRESLLALLEGAAN
jgi:4Fe-4S ferredoxin